MKTKWMPVMIAALLAIAPVSLARESLPWGSPWEPDDKANLHSLLNKGYSIIDTNTLDDSRGFAEIIYVQRGKSVYRCITVNARDTTTHTCEKLVAPEKNTRLLDMDANRDIKNAYTAAQAFYTDYPTGAVTMDKLRAYGFVPSRDVKTSLLNGKVETLEIRTEHLKGVYIFTVDAAGAITKTEK